MELEQWKELERGEKSFVQKLLPVTSLFVIKSLISV